MPNIFDPANAAQLDDPQRLLWSPPDELMASLGLRPGGAVADIGAGTGYFVLPLAQAVAPDGVVYAIDSQPAMLDKLQERLALTPPPARVVRQHGDAAQTGLPPESVDLALMANLWHELDDHDAALTEAARLLRPGGRIAVVDWRPDSLRPPGPPAEERLPAAHIAAALTRGGWTIETNSPLWQHHHLVIATAPREKRQEPH